MSFPLRGWRVVGVRRLGPGQPWPRVGPGLVRVMWTTSPGILRQPHLLAKERDGTFSVHVGLTVLELARLENQKRKKKEDDDFLFFQTLFS